MLQPKLRYLKNDFYEIVKLLEEYLCLQKDSVLWAKVDFWSNSFFQRRKLNFLCLKKKNYAENPQFPHFNQKRGCETQSPLRSAVVALPSGFFPPSALALGLLVFKIYVILCNKMHTWKLLSCIPTATFSLVRKKIAGVAEHPKL